MSLMSRPSPKSRHAGFVCVRCQHHCFERDRVMGTNVTPGGYVKSNWCQLCADEDDAAIPKTESTFRGFPVALRHRLPSHMLPDCNDPVKWRKADNT